LDGGAAKISGKLKPHAAFFSCSDPARSVVSATLFSLRAAVSGLAETKLPLKDTKGSIPANEENHPPVPDAEPDRSEVSVSVLFCFSFSVLFSVSFRFS
jgi:hypothetical protein